jgi:hypothetical protein
MLLPRLCILFLATAAAAPLHTRGDGPGPSAPWSSYCGVNNGKAGVPIPPMPSGFTLKQVQTFIRHGAWAKNYIKGRNSLPGNCMLGQLTEIGHEQQIANGEALRAAYIGPNATVGNLLPPAMTPADIDRDVFLRSDDVERTILSGQALAKGLLNLGAASSAKVPLAWNTMDPEQDNMYPNTNVCPAYLNALNTFESSDAMKEFETSLLAPFIADVRPVLWKDNRTLGKDDVLLMWDCFWTHECPGEASLRSAIPPALLTQPKSGKGSLADRLSYLVGKSQGMLTTDKDVARFGIGPLIGEFLKAMRPAADGETTAKKFVLYSGHDTGPMMPLLGAFGVFASDPFVFTPYASLISFELVENTSSKLLFVRMVYNGNVMRIPWKGCGPVGGKDNWMCPWDGFISGAAALVPTTEECAKKGQVSEPRTGLRGHPLLHGRKGTII